MFVSTKLTCCKGTTMSCGLNYLGFETQGPVIVVPEEVRETLQGLRVSKFCTLTMDTGTLLFHCTGYTEIICPVHVT